MRQAGLFVALMAACGGGGGGSPSAIEQIVSLGSVSAGTMTFDVSVANPLGEDAVVDQKSGGVGGGFVLALGALPADVTAGGAVTLPVVFTPPGSGLREGEIRVRFVAGKQEREVALRFTANVEKVTLNLLTPTLSFPDTILGQQTTISVQLKNESVLTTVSMKALQGLPAEFSSSFVPRKMLPGDYLVVPVTYAPTARGSHDFDLTITNDASAPVKVRVIASTASWPDEQIIDFGNVPMTNNLSEWLEVYLPPDAISLTIETDGPVGLDRLEGPGGVVYWDSQLGGPFRWTDNTFASYGVFSPMLPQDDRPDCQLVPGGGIYRFRFYYLYAFAGELTQTPPVRAIVHNRVGGVINGGVLDLNIFLAKGLAIADPPSDAKLQAVIQRVRDILSPVGLQVGDISYITLTNSAYDEVDSVYVSAEQPQLFQLSNNAPDNRLNVYFVLTVNAGGVPLGGLAPMIPGVKRTGTWASGVLVDYDFGVAAAVGHVAAHEIGHYLGLWHAESDYIDDTVSCEGTYCIAGDGNLMYTGTMLGLPIVTAGQANIILRHALVAPDPLAELSGLAQTTAPEVTYVQLPKGFCGNCAGSK